MFFLVECCCSSLVCEFWYSTIHQLSYSQILNVIKLQPAQLSQGNTSWAELLRAKLVAVNTCFLLCSDTQESGKACKSRRLYCYNNNTSLLTHSFQQNIFLKMYLLQKTFSKIYLLFWKKHAVLSRIEYVMNTAIALHLRHLNKAHAFLHARRYIQSYYEWRKDTSCVGFVREDYLELHKVLIQFLWNTNRVSKPVDRYPRVELGQVKVACKWTKRRKEELILLQLERLFWKWISMKIILAMILFANSETNGKSRKSKSGVQKSVTSARVGFRVKHRFS